jgi:hypothetical protein
MKEIFSRKTFWAILVILLLAVFVYPPWLEKEFIRGYLLFVHRYWDLIFIDRTWNSSMKSIELDLKMILAESIIAILLAIGICLIPFNKGNKKRIS